MIGEHNQWRGQDITLGGKIYNWCIYTHFILHGIIWKIKSHSLEYQVKFNFFFLKKKSKKEGEKTLIKKIPLDYKSYIISIVAHLVQKIFLQLVEMINCKL